MSLSRAELNQLRSLMGKLSLTKPPPQKSKPRKRNRRKGRRTAGGVPAGAVRGTNASGVGSSNGEIVVTRTELVGSVIQASSGDGTGSINMFPDASAFAWLHKVRSAFDRIEWMSATLHWKPFVGTNTSGSIAYGVDWNSSVVSLTRAKVQATTPVYESPVWQSGQLALPARYLMSRKVYLLEAENTVDKQPGTIIWALAGTGNPPSTGRITFGEIWCTYKVRLSGTTS